MMPPPMQVIVNVAAVAALLAPTALPTAPPGVAHTAAAQVAGAEFASATALDRLLAAVPVAPTSGSTTTASTAPTAPPSSSPPTIPVGSWKRPTVDTTWEAPSTGDYTAPGIDTSWQGPGVGDTPGTPGIDERGQQGPVDTVTTTTTIPVPPVDPRPEPVATETVFMCLAQTQGETVQQCGNFTPLVLRADGTWEWMVRAIMPDRGETINPDKASALATGRFTVDGDKVVFETSAAAQGVGPTGWGTATIVEQGLLFPIGRLYAIVDADAQSPRLAGLQGTYVCSDASTEACGSHCAAATCAPLRIGPGRHWSQGTYHGDLFIFQDLDAVLLRGGGASGPARWGLLNVAAGTAVFDNQLDPAMQWRRGVEGTPGMVAGDYRCACDSRTLQLLDDGSWALGFYHGSFDVVAGRVYFGGTSVGPPDWGAARIGAQGLLFPSGIGAGSWERQA